MGSGGGLGKCVFRYGKHTCTKNVVGFSWVWMPRGSRDIMGAE